MQYAPDPEVTCEDLSSTAQRNFWKMNIWKCWKLARHVPARWRPIASISSMKIIHGALSYRLCTTFAFPSLVLLQFTLQLYGSRPVQMVTAAPFTSRDKICRNYRQNSNAMFLSSRKKRRITISIHCSYCRYCCISYWYGCETTAIEPSPSWRDRARARLQHPRTSRQTRNQSMMQRAPRPKRMVLSKEMIIYF